MERRPEYDSERDEALFWRIAESLEREPVRWRPYPLLLLLLVVASTPFYWDAEAAPPRLLGMPAWVWVAIACSAAVSCLTAWTAISHWDDAEPDAEHPPGDPRERAGQ